MNVLMIESSFPKAKRRSVRFTELVHSQWILGANDTNMIARVSEVQMRSQGRIECLAKIPPTPCENVTNV